MLPKTDGLTVAALVDGDCAEAACAASIDPISAAVAKTAQVGLDRRVFMTVGAPVI